MTEGIPNKLKLEDIVAPIFDAAMGRRLATARMWRLWDQHELGERLGINSHTVSDLETGKLLVPRSPFSVTKLYEVLGPTGAGYVLLERYASSFNAGQIHSKFIHQKLAVLRQRRPLGQRAAAKVLAGGGKLPRGSTLFGIDRDVWDTAIRLTNERKKKNTKPIK